MLKHCNFGKLLGVMTTLDTIAVWYPVITAGGVAPAVWYAESVNPGFTNGAIWSLAPDELPTLGRVFEITVPRADMTSRGANEGGAVDSSISGGSEGYLLFSHSNTDEMTNYVLRAEKVQVSTWSVPNQGGGSTPYIRFVGVVTAYSNVG